MKCQMVIQEPVSIFPQLAEKKNRGPKLSTLRQKSINLRGVKRTPKKNMILVHPQAVKEKPFFHEGALEYDSASVRLSGVSISKLLDKGITKE